MKINNIIAVLLLLLASSSCNYFKHKTDAPQVNEFETLDSTAILHTDMVSGFKPSDSAAFYAHSLYVQAVDIHDNKKDVKASLPLFLMSIRLAPEPSKYVKYADALYDDGQYEYAETVYKYSTYSDNNKADAILGTARCEAHTPDGNGALYDLELALNSFPFDVKKIQEDKAFERFHNDEAFKLILARHIADDATRKKAMMAIFEKLFPVQALPYSIGEDKVFTHGGGDIDYKYMEFIPDLVTTMYPDQGYQEVQAIAAVNFSPLFRSFIFREVVFNADTMHPVHEFLATFNEKDTRQDQRVLTASMVLMALQAQPKRMV